MPACHSCHAPLALPDLPDGVGLTNVAVQCANCGARCITGTHQPTTPDIPSPDDLWPQLLDLVDPTDNEIAMARMIAVLYLGQAQVQAIIDTLHGDGGEFARRLAFVMDHVQVRRVRHPLALDARMITQTLAEAYDDLEQEARAQALAQVERQAQAGAGGAAVPADARTPVFPDHAADWIGTEAAVERGGLGRPSDTARIVDIADRR